MVVGLTLLLAPVTTPTPWSMDRLVAPVTLQERVELCPTWIDAGVAVKEAISGALVPPLVSSLPELPHAVASTRSATESAVERPLLVTSGFPLP